MAREITTGRAGLGSPATPAAPSRFWGWVDSRLGLHALGYEIPAHANSILYTLGGITAFAFLLASLSGLYLLLFYNPQPAAARDSVVYILQTAPFGSFVRGGHFWTANLMIVTLLLHMGRVFATGAYKAPRELNWVVGVGLLATTVGLMFTGTVLKWDQEAYEALTHGEEIGRTLGPLGSWLTTDFTRSASLLTRFFGFHVVVLPFLLVALMGVHFWLVKHHGISGLPGRHEAQPGRTDTQVAMARDGASTFTLHLLHLVGWGLVLAAIASLLTFVVGSSLGPEVVRGVEVTKPPWIFLPVYTLENWFGLKALMVGPVILFILLLAVPFLDRTPVKAYARRKVLIASGIALFAAVVALGVLAVLTQGKAHIGM